MLKFFLSRWFEVICQFSFFFEISVKFCVEPWHHLRWNGNRMSSQLHLHHKFKINCVNYIDYIEGINWCLDTSKMRRRSNHNKKLAEIFLSDRAATHITHPKKNGHNCSGVIPWRRKCPLSQSLKVLLWRARLRVVTVRNPEGLLLPTCCLHCCQTNNMADFSGPVPHRTFSFSPPIFR